MSAPVENRRDTGYRNDLLWLAAMIHRLSGILLACFLPMHFLALGLALEGEAKLDSFLKWSESPIVKFAETGLVFLLAIHLLGGIRLLLIENLPWEHGQKQMAMVAIVIAVGVSALFLLRFL